jgi:hypothetical protein
MSSTENDVIAGFWNLHDAFLSVHLQRMCMLNAPVSRGDPLKDNPLAFFASPRGLHERAYGAFLYVLVEAWEAKRWESVREYIETMATTAEIGVAIREGRDQGHLEELRQLRHFMCHRDQRDYWDRGHFAAVGQIDYHERLYQAFNRMFLDCIRARQPAVKPTSP